MKYLKITPLVLLLLYSCNLFIDDGLDPINDPVEKTKQETLDALGVNINPGARKDRSGNDLDSTDNPFGKEYTVHSPKREVYRVGEQNGGEYLLEDSTSNFDSLVWGGYDSDWMSLPKKAVAADLDGDGLDEIVVVVFFSDSIQIKVRVPDNNNTGFRDEYTHQIASGDTRLPVTFFGGWTRDKYFQRDVSCGDLDGDGRSEIAITINNHLLVIDDPSEGFADLGTTIFPHLQTGLATYLRVESGDIDGDACDELVLTNGAYGNGTGMFYWFDDISSGGNYNDLSTNGTVLNGGTFNLVAAEVKIGDFDGDQINEIAFGGYEQGSDPSHMWLYVFNTLNTTTKTMEIAPISTYWFEGYSAAYLADSAIPPMAVGDFNLDGKDDIYCVKSIFTINDSNSSLAGLSGFPLDSQGVFDLAEAGDLDGDGRAELWIYKSDPQDLHDNNKIDYFYTYELTAAGNVESPILSGLSCSGYHPSFCLPNIDGDSLVLKFLNSKLVFSNPIILAVLACPPYYSGIDMNLNACETAISFSETSSTEESGNSGFSVGVAITAGFSLGPFDAGGAQTMTNSFSWSYGSYEQETLTYGYSLEAGNDMVIMTCVPFDVYEYEIVSHFDHSEVGGKLHISVPRKFEKYFVSVETYNSAVNESQQISSQVLMHTIGDPFSYADGNHRQTLLDEHGGSSVLVNEVTAGAWFPADPTTVPQGSSSTSISFDYEEGTTSGFDYTFDFSEQFNFQVLVGADYDFTFSQGYSYGNNVGKGIGFSGTVGGIVKQSDWTDHRYSWGMMGYPVSDTIPGQDFFLLTYWVEPN
jgi:hypothetical protein